MIVMRRYHTEAEQSKLLAFVATFGSVLARRDFHWLRLLRDTGLRIGEFAAMDRRDARFALEQRWIFIPAEHRKGKADRRKDHELPIGKAALESIERLLAIALEMGGSDEPGAPLVLSRQGRMSIRSYQDRYAHWSEAAGIGHASPHWMRHTRAMNLMRRTRGRDPRGVVQGLLGHASIASTGIYTAVTKEDLVAAVEDVDGKPRIRRGQLARMYREFAEAA